MKPVTRAVYVVVCSLLLFSATAYADDFEIHNAAEVEQAVVRTQTICSYTMDARDPKNPPAQATARHHFNSFFVRHAVVGGKQIETLVTSGHSFLCDSTLYDIFGEANTEWYDVDSFKGSVAAVLVWQGNAEQGPGAVVSVRYTQDFYDPIDIATFTIELPAGTPHKHLSIGSPAWYGVESKVVVRGFMNPHDAHISIFRYKEGLIEAKGTNAVRISTSLYPGMSGSPLTLRHKGKWYAIGVMVRYGLDRQNGFWDASWATIIPKDFLK